MYANKRLCDLRQVESVSELLCMNANKSVLVYDRLIQFATAKLRNILLRQSAVSETILNWP